MSPVSPISGDTSLVSFTIRVDGKDIPSTYQVVSMNTWNAVNKVPKARVVIFDGSPATGDFEISNLETFVPGKSIEIAAGYSGKNTTIFKGTIVKQGIQIDQTRGSKLVVNIEDPAIKMTLERKNALFEKIKDSDLIGKLISQNSLQKSVTATTTVHEEIVQYYASDWDLMLTRAEMNGFVVMVDAGRVTVAAPDTQKMPDLVVTYGDSILDLDAEMDAASQYASSAIKSQTWDAASQSLIESGPGTVSIKEPGNISSAELAKVFGVKKFTQQTGASIEKGALKDWSSAELIKSKLAKIRGTVRFQGNAKARTGTTIELAGLGKRFNGVAFISGVHHNISNGAWLTTVEFGLSPTWFAERARNIAAPDASAQLPPIKGLQTGVVEKVATDPGGEYRVLVRLPLVNNQKGKGVWARLGTFYGSNKVGAVFYPEVKDEVIVGFMNQDPRYPVILGSVYSKKLAPPYPPDAQNTKKAIVTRSKLEIYFDDQKKIIEIKTPGKHTIKMDDSTGAISIKDSNRNTISLSKGGITLDSASNITIKSKANINVQAGANLTLSAKANATVKGLQVSNSAQAKFSAKGNASSELTTPGILTIRGSLVKIN